jgi:hypothetical protein
LTSVSNAIGTDRAFATEPTMSKSRQPAFGVVVIRP